MTHLSAPNSKTLLLLLSCAMLALGNCGGPLLTRLYFLHGGARVWLSSGLETAGWPILLLPLALRCCRRRSGGSGAPSKLFSMNPLLFSASASLGVLTGLDDYLYAYGVARLPVSTSIIIIATQLAFTAAFAFLLVRQRFTSYSINAIILLTVGAVVLGLHANGDRPAGEAAAAYYKGFFMTTAAAALYGFVLPAVELTYKRAAGGEGRSFWVVVEVQLVISFAATAFCVVGMLVNDDFKVIPREAREYGLGEARYYVVLVWTAILWQFFFVGALGVIFCASSLFSGILIAVLLPVTEILAVVIYKEKFEVDKGMALVLSLWGFASYFYGDYKQAKEKAKENEGPQIP